MRTEAFRGFISLDSSILLWWFDAAFQAAFFCLNNYIRGWRAVAGYAAAGLVACPQWVGGQVPSERAVHSLSGIRRIPPGPAAVVVDPARRGTVRHAWVGPEGPGSRLIGVVAVLVSRVVFL